MDIDELRARIDAVDDELLNLLNERARLVEEVGLIKQQLQRPFYVPGRERSIIERLLGLNQGPFPSEGIKPVFQEIFSACLSLEKGIRVAYLGPEATFTHAAVKFQFGLSARAVPMGSIAGVFQEVERGEADFGVVPVENATEGVVNHTLDMFMESPLRICAEVVLKITHCLLARAGLDFANIFRVYSHPQALAQCRGWLTANMPGAARVEASSTAEAARMAREDVNGAAIASELAAKLYDLHLVKRNLEDMAENATRFLVIGREVAKKTGNDKTSLLAVIPDGPGTLFRLLQPFAEHGVNLTKIESRPTRRKVWEYAFFLDLDGHESEEKVIKAMDDIRAFAASLKVLGSYPKGSPADPRP
ncbi:MAG: prephenate dehydratase [Acidobacteria bacterium]|nr:prephenate dehydratase [Acidobacteriota bacterium]MCK6680934.1 prephenate dehydratase [Thermoanaerobaculia bacterium]